MGQIIDWATKLVTYGCIGWIIEILFTGFYSLLIQKNKTAPAKTYLWMLPIYGLAGIVLELVQNLLTWPWYFRPLIYLPLIYGIEGVSGWLIRKITGRCPWDYGNSRWTPLGLIHLGYTPFWLFLGFLFDPISNIMGKIITFLASGY